ncbi:maestro heat-like repeat-containing protein family member 6 [Myiozetetes cayanensis]|uniref:maestro heat-like repeat-containing protein family member 6 n=1 Tax=Myiozetetes cayanensis TaxID=478635 RepID=UPI00216064FC|nr:maestro heat-like repeat-containing protein family member 6 [Myiozetetes cayanensis]
MDLMRVTDAHPTDVVVTLLRCAPSCDRAAASMWRTIASSGMTLEKVLPKLLSVMEDWPVHSMCTSDGDKTDVFALAATRVIWEILRLPWCPEPVLKYFPRLLVDLLFQVFMSTKQMPEEVASFWRGCQEKSSLTRNPNRFAVQTVRALLRRLQRVNLVMAMERKRGWDTLLSADTHHYAVGLLAREMRRTSSPLCSPVALCLLGVLIREKPRWEVPAMAFLVEVLDYLDMIECGDGILQILSRDLANECKERRRLAIRGFVMLSKDPMMARRMCSLSGSLVQLLWDADVEVVELALPIFLNMLRKKDIITSSPTALKLAEALRPLFDSDNSHVQALSIRLFQEVMKSVVDVGKKPLKIHVIQNLLPLFLYWHDENQRSGRASREALLCVAKFLKRKDLEQLLKTEQPLKFGECLLEKDRSRVANYLRQALPYLESPQEPLREAAIKFMGMAGWYMRGRPEELQVICEALQAMRKDNFPSYTSVMVQALFDQRAEVLLSSSASRQLVSQEEHQTPRSRRSTGDQRRSSVAPSTDTGSN